MQGRIQWGGGGEGFLGVHKEGKHGAQFQSDYFPDILGFYAQH